MKTYIWDNLKQRIARDVYSSINIYNQNAMTSILLEHLHNPTQDFRSECQKSLAYLKNKAYDIVMAWDIRMAKTLFNIFPNSVGKTLREGNIVADYDEKGRWVLEVV